MNNAFLTAATIGLVALITAFTRGLPYLLWGGKKKLPDRLTYLSSVLPASIMIILVVYCLRNIDLSAAPYGLAELLSVAAVIIFQRWRKNTILSMVIGTICYMILIRIL